MPVTVYRTPYSTLSVCLHQARRHYLLCSTLRRSRLFRTITMSAAGPEIPAELLAKRKRQEDAQDTSEAGRPASPLSPSSSPASAGKRRRVIGPSLPPAPLGERPEDLQKSDDGDSSSEGEMGPALPVLTDRKVCEPSTHMAASSDRTSRRTTRGG